MEFPTDLQILAIDDNPDILLSLRLLLKPYTKEFHANRDPESIPSFVGRHDYDLILLDMNYNADVGSGTEGFYWIEKLQELVPDVPVICVTAYGDTEKAVRAMKMGASDFVVKPWDNDKLLATVFSNAKMRAHSRVAKEEKAKQQLLSNDMAARFSDFIGEDESMLDVFADIEKVGPTDASVLVLGENGTGKELVARALHARSDRRNKIFVSVDLGAIHENLFESELFGHVKGAFTDAKKDKPGRFELANGGTIFLDEIGNLSLPLQAKLLTVLERRELVRVGGTKVIPLDVRVICATNSDIHKLVQQGTFRSDLLFRINTVELQLPALRERGIDCLVLADFYLKKFSKKYKRGNVVLTASAKTRICSYSWPGNVRELQHAMERAVILCEGTIVQEHDIISKNVQPEERGTLPSYNLEEIERYVISHVMEMHKGNISSVAKELGVSRAALYRRLEKYGI